MCLKSEYVYFPQVSGYVYHPVLTSFTLSVRLVITLMVMTVPSVKVLHGSPWSCSETSIPPGSCLCGCWSPRLQNSTLLVIHASRTPEFHDAGCAEARGEPSAQHISPSSFPEMCWTRRNRSYAKHPHKEGMLCNQVKFAWCGFGNGFFLSFFFFLSMQGTVSGVLV